jgi:peptidoglycan/xylan/chitin deacetylase (PgdA/CDA1 family)
MARGLSALGVVRILEAFGRRPGLLVLNYHRVGSPAANPLDDGVYSASTNAFRAQMRYLRRRFAVPALDEVITAAEAGFRFARPTALVTFDDGYRDNLENAFPVLREEGLPAVFFVCPTFASGNYLPWWDRIAYVFKQSRRPTFSLDYPVPYQVDLQYTPRKAALFNYLRAFRGYERSVDEAKYFRHLEERAAVTVPAEDLRQRLFMNWDEIRSLKNGGMAIGSHTVTHPILARLTESEQLEELVRSKKTISAELSCPVETLAYPVGTKAAFTEATKLLARQAGYRMAFSYYGQMNRPGHSELFDVHRFSVEHSDSMPTFRARLVWYSSFGTSPF